MNKEQFIRAFRKKLRGMPREEIAKTVSYYEEIIADKIEGGMSEQEAVASLGNLDELARSARGAEPETAEKSPRMHEAPAPWIIILLVLGSPIWIGIGAGLFGVVIGFWATLFSLIVTLFSVMIGLLIGHYALLFSLDVTFFALITGSFAGGVAELAKAFLLMGQDKYQVFISAGTGILLIGVGILLILSIKPIVKWSWKIVKLPVVVPSLAKPIMLWFWKLFRLPWLGCKRFFGRVQR